MDKLKGVKKIVDIIDELHKYNHPTRWMRFLNWFRVRFKMAPLERLVIDPRREKVLKRRVIRIKKKMYGTNQENNN